MSELSWVELMGRHAASAALYVSGAMNYLDAEGQRQQFLWWHGPAAQWRIALPDGTPIYLKDATGRSFQRNSAGDMQELGGRITVPILGPVSPLDVVAPESMLNQISQHAAVVAGPLHSTVDGRKSWKVTLAAGTSEMFIEVDDETGVLLQAQSADYPEPGFTIIDLRTDNNDNAAWFSP
ncbi:hypothetical protein [Gordonia sp. NPDC127522]|uniref:hypothetical protein n=1 Tax=Gordonia sp. NPDC127522 TaxID=3345390 RepID=UPI00364151D9